MISLVDFMATIFYVALIVLIIVLIVFVIRAIKTLGRIDKVLDDISEKASKLDGVFNIIDSTTEVVSGISDNLIAFIKNSIENIFRKKGKENE